MTTTTTTTTTAAPTFNGHDFAHGIMRDKKRGAAGFAAIKGAALLIDALRRAGCEPGDLSSAIMDVAREYRSSLTESAIRTHGETVRLISGV